MRFLKLFLYKKYYLINNIIRNLKDVKFLYRCTYPQGGGIVVLTHESNYLGASLLAYNIAKEIKAQGINAYIITRHFGKLNKEYAKIAPLKICLTKAEFRTTLKQLKEAGFYKILINTSVNGDLVDIAKSFDFKTVTLIHETKPVIASIQLEHAICRILQGSDVVVFPTKLLKVQIEGEFGKCNKKTVILPQGLYLKEKANRPIEKKVIRVIGVGNTNYIKGFDIFIKIASFFNNDVEFCWAGRRERFFEQVQSENEGHFPDNFKYFGLITNKNDLVDFYRSATLLALTSRYDTFPSVMLESMDAGVPVLGFKDSGGIVEIVENMKNGYLVEGKEDVDEFARIINLFLNLSKDEWGFISTTCKETALKYSFPKYVENLTKLF